jgi:hypothetical protein
MLRRPNILALTLLVAGAVALAGSARAQCIITGPTQVCPGDFVTLCGPDGFGAYDWTLPDGVHVQSQCVSSTELGTYTLSVFDAKKNLWSAPCSQTVAATSPAPVPVITGTTSACTGGSVSLSGPTGDYLYSWNGPGGFASDSASVTLTVAGAYTLTTLLLPDGCWSDTATAAVTFNACGGGGDPPATPTTNCPRPAWWWETQCNHRWGQPTLTDQQMATVAACVSSQDALLGSAGPGGSVCNSLRDGPHSLRTRALRQVAAVRSNICAGQLGIAPMRGRAIALNPSTPLTLPRTGGTIADWLAHSDAVLAGLQSASRNDRGARRTYLDVIRVGWCINHGMGIGATCMTRSDHRSGGEMDATAMTGDVATLSTDGTSVPVDAQEPLSVQLLDDSDGPLTFGALEPNPFTTETRLAYSISTSAPAVVTIGVFDISGRMVRQLVSATQTTGQYEARWDGRTTNGAPAKSGLYFILGRIGGQQVQTRVTIVR